MIEVGGEDVIMECLSAETVKRIRGRGILGVRKGEGKGLEHVGKIQGHERIRAGMQGDNQHSNKEDT